MSNRVLDLCSGIGGFALGMERAGFQTVAFCETNRFCREVLHSHWPEVPQFHDIRKLQGWHVGPVDIITAGFPCQPYSLAGKQKGAADPRNVWPDVCRLVREIMPEWFVGENVPGLDGKHMALDGVLVDLESAGYEAITIEIPACSVDAPHIRKRLFIVANRNGKLFNGTGHIGARWRNELANGGTHGCLADAARQSTRTTGCTWQYGDVANGESDQRSKGRPEHEREQGRSAFVVTSGASRSMGNGALPGCAGQWVSDRPTERPADFDSQWASAEWLVCPDGRARRVKPGVRLLASRVPRRVDSIRAYGNAVVPQIVEKIGWAIQHARSL